MPEAGRVGLCAVGALYAIQIFGNAVDPARLGKPEGATWTCHTAGRITHPAVALGVEAADPRQLLAR